MNLSQYRLLKDNEKKEIMSKASECNVKLLSSWGDQGAGHCIVSGKNETDLRSVSEFFLQKIDSAERASKFEKLTYTITEHDLSPYSGVTAEDAIDKSKYSDEFSVGSSSSVFGEKIESPKKISKEIGFHKEVEHFDYYLHDKYDFDLVHLCYEKKLNLNVDSTRIYVEGEKRNVDEFCEKVTEWIDVTNFYTLPDVSQQKIKVDFHKLRSLEISEIIRIHDYARQLEVLFTSQNNGEQYTFLTAYSKDNEAASQSLAFILQTIDEAKNLQSNQSLDESINSQGYSSFDNKKGSYIDTNESDLNLNDNKETISAMLLASLKGNADFNVDKDVKMTKGKVDFLNHEHFNSLKQIAEKNNVLLSSSRKGFRVLGHNQQEVDTACENIEQLKQDIEPKEMRSFMISKKEGAGKAEKIIVGTKNKGSGALAEAGSFVYLPNSSKHANAASYFYKNK